MRTTWRFQPCSRRRPEDEENASASSAEGNNIIEGLKIKGYSPWFFQYRDDVLFREVLILGRSVFRTDFPTECTRFYTRRARREGTAWG